MRAQPYTIKREEAIRQAELTGRKGQVYLSRFDTEIVFRRGTVKDSQIDYVRYKEDARPQQREIKNKTTGNTRKIDKKNDIITYRNQTDGELYVLRRSGGVSLFDGMSSKIPFRKNHQWYVITKDAKLPADLIIAKDIHPDIEGNHHYSIEPDKDMSYETYIAKLSELREYITTLEEYELNKV